MTIIIKSMLAIIIILTLYIVLPHFYKKIYWKYASGQIKKPEKIYLTFDDGPDPENTDKILKLLDKYGIKATFFIRGNQAEKYPELVQAIRNAGHAIGFHGYEHYHGWKTGPFKTWYDFQKGEKAFKRLGIKTDLYRPPYGKLNIVHVYYIVFKKKKMILWNVDPEDYQTSSEKIADVIRRNAVPGAILLLHDGRASAVNNSTDITINAMAMLDDFLKANSSRFDIFSGKYLSGL